MRRIRNKRRLSYEFKDGKWQAKLLERHVVKEIIDRLWFQARIRVVVINQPVGGKTPQNEAGIPDLIGWIPHRPMLIPLPEDIRDSIPPPFRVADVPGMALFIEVKRPGGKRRPAQERFIEDARAGGCCAFFAESWNDVVTELSKYGIPLQTLNG